MPYFPSKAFFYITCLKKAFFSNYTFFNWFDFYIIKCLYICKYMFNVECCEGLVRWILVQLNLNPLQHSLVKYILYNLWHRTWTSVCPTPSHLLQSEWTPLTVSVLFQSKIWHHHVHYNLCGRRFYSDVSLLFSPSDYY